MRQWQSAAELLVEESWPVVRTTCLLENILLYPFRSRQAGCISFGRAISVDSFVTLALVRKGDVIRGACYALEAVLERSTLCYLLLCRFHRVFFSTESKWHVTIVPTNAILFSRFRRARTFRQIFVHEGSGKKMRERRQQTEEGSRDSEVRTQICGRAPGVLWAFRRFCRLLRPSLECFACSILISAQIQRIPNSTNLRGESISCSSEGFWRTEGCSEKAVFGPLFGTS